MKRQVAHVDHQRGVVEHAYVDLGPARPRRNQRLIAGRVPGTKGPPDPSGITKRHVRGRP